jgi:Putative abortive phage resistance protein AbiGi, antitoxin
VALGYRGNKFWRDMSDYLVHLTPTPTDWLSILQSCRLSAGGPFGWLSTHRDEPESQKSSCLSEIPMDYLPRLADRHGSYGVVFERKFIENLGGSRVWYLEKGSPASDALFEIVKARHFPVIQEEDPLLDLTPYIDFLNENRSFEWEREWRVVGDLEFVPKDVQYLFMPGEKHSDARRFLDKRYKDGEGPDLSHAPMIDPYWSDEEVQAVLGMTG